MTTFKIEQLICFISDSMGKSFKFWSEKHVYISYTVPLSNDYGFNSQRREKQVLPSESFCKNKDLNHPDCYVHAYLNPFPLIN